MGSEGVIANLPGFPAGSVELLLEGDPDFPRFVQIEEGRCYRSYLARIRGGHSRTGGYVALKVQRDQYSLDDQESGALSFRNEDVEQHLEREHASFLEADRRRISRYLATYFPLAGERSTDGRWPLTVLPPLLFWSARRLLFHPPCPTCGELLRDCRDDRLLARHNLALFSETDTRYLHCPSCAREESGQPVHFYRVLPTEQEEALHVGNEAKLYDDLARGLGQSEEPSLPLLAPGGGRLSIRPGELKPEALTAFSFHETRILPFEFLPLTWRTFCYALGDMPWDTLRSEAAAGWGGTLPDDTLLNVKRRLTSPDRYLFAEENRWPLEVLRLKLGLFRELAAAVHVLHEESGAAHLALRPENIMVALPETAGGLAGLWNFSVKLRTLSAAACPHKGDEERPPEFQLRLLETGPDYLPPFARDQALAAVHSAEVRLKSLRPSDDDARHQVRLLLYPSDGISVRRFSAGDLFEITLTGPGFAEPLTISARHPVAVARNGVELESAPVHLSENDLNAVRANLNRIVRNVSFRCHPLYAVPCDLHSLAMVLLEALLGDPETDAQVISEKLVRPAVEAIRSAREKNPGLTDSDIEGCILDFLQKNEWARPTRLTRRAGGQLTDAADLWCQALLLGLKLATNIRDFSWCAHRDDFPHDKPAELLSRLEEEVQAIACEAHRRLFALPAPLEAVGPPAREIPVRSAVLSAGETAEVQEEVRAVLRELLLGPPSRRRLWIEPPYRERVENLLKNLDPLAALKAVVPPLGHVISLTSNNLSGWLVKPYGLSQPVLRFHTALAQILEHENHESSVQEYLESLRSCIKELVEQPLAVVGESLGQLELHFNPKNIADNSESDKLTKGRKAVAWDRYVEAYGRALPFEEFVFPRIRRHIEERLERFLFRLTKRQGR